MRIGSETFAKDVKNYLLILPKRVRGNIEDMLLYLNDQYEDGVWGSKKRLKRRVEATNKVLEIFG